MSRAFVWAFAACLSAAPASAAVLARVPAAGLSAVSAPAIAVSASAPALLSPAILPAAVAPALPLAASALAPAPLAAAPALAAPAAPAPALPRAAAALDVPGAPENPGESAAPAPAPKSAEEAAAQAAKAFDGAAAKTADAPAAPEPAPAAKPKREKFPLGAGLKAADPEDEPWLADLVGTLARSKTGRRILQDIAALEKKRGHPTMVVIKAIGNNGEFRYDSDLLVMDAAHRRRAPELTAPIFAHELQHVLQRALDLPVDALELEIESYTVESRVWTELGVEPEKGSFAKDARVRLRKDPDAFFVWLGKEYKPNKILHGRTMAAYIKDLAKQQPRNLKLIAKLEKELDKARRVAASMRAEGKPEDAVRSFEQDDVESVVRRLRDAHVEKGWIERDLALLSTEEGRARFRAYSRGVVRRARALARP